MCTSLAALLLISLGPWNPGSGIFSLWKSLWNLQISSDLYRSVLQIAPQITRKVSGKYRHCDNQVTCARVSMQGDVMGRLNREILGASEGRTMKYTPKKDSWSPLIQFDLANFLVFIWVLTTTTICIYLYYLLCFCYVSL